MLMKFDLLPDVFICTVMLGFALPSTKRFLGP